MMNRASGQDITLDNLTAFAGKSPALVTFGETLVGDISSDWKSALHDCQILHISGISFGLAYHSKYEHNYLLEAFEEAIPMKPENCTVGLDSNYRATLWFKDQCQSVMTPLITNHVDVLITTIEDMAAIYGIGCGQ